MSYPVTYYCPHCEAVVELEREGYLDDRSVTPYPLEGWEYARPDESFEDADGVRIVCGEEGLLRDGDETGCGEPFYLSFVRFENGEEVEPPAESEFVEIGTGPGPSGPRGPSGPGRYFALRWGPVDRLSLVWVWWIAHPLILQTG